MSEESEKEPDNILEFRQRPENKPWDPLTENMTDMKRLDYLEHKHGPFIIDDREREVTCKRCGKVIDPIYALVMITRWWNELDYKIKAYKEFEQRAKDRYERRLAREKLKHEPMK